MKTSPQYTALKARLLKTRYTWVITGVAGFIGSNLLETLLRHNQAVVGLDNFSTGHQHNLDQVRDSVSAEQRSSFRMVAGDIRELKDCQESVRVRIMCCIRPRSGPCPGRWKIRYSPTKITSMAFLICWLPPGMPRSSVLSMRHPVLPMVTIPACPRLKMPSANRCHPTPSPST